MPHDRERRRRLGEILLDEGALSQDQLEEALAEQGAHAPRERLGTTVVRLGFCREVDIAQALARQLGYDTVDLSDEGPEAQALARVSRRLAERHQALPLRIEDEGTLVVAMSDPTNVVALDDLRITARMRSVRPLVAPESDVAAALRRAYGTDQTALEMMDALDGGDVRMADEPELEDLARLTETVEEAPVKRLANAILSDAVRTRASDVHVEPTRDAVRVRYRIDGILRETMHVPRNIGPALTSRIKIMSNLDIAERRRPQDGRAMIRVEGQDVDLRVSTMPAMFGETVVLRLLRKGAERLGMTDLGMSSEDLSMFEYALDRPQGLIICTGPTGSGKTTTLYAGLTRLADPVRNIITLEDPIEYQLEGVNQTQINPKIGLTFARGLRTVLRQDPDVVMVGEIRDQETAELAMEASFTGHLVLSTLHTNDAPSTIVRLLDLGVERFLIASSLLQVVGQRLVRVVCNHCGEPTAPDERTVRLLGLTADDVSGGDLRRGTGCQICEGTGFRGRVGIYELLAVTPQMREAVLSGASETAIARLARSQGMRTLREDGVRKAMEGVTTLEEVLRVTPEESTAVQRCPRCNALVGDDFVVCPHCELALDLLSCAGCGQRLEAGWTVCPYCRAPASSEQVRASSRGAAGASREAAVQVAAVAAEPGSGDGGPAPENGKGGHRREVLVVDDDESLREVLQAQLEETYTVLQAADGESALDLFRRDHPDAVILDLKLPDIDGIEVARRVRGSDHGFRVPILMLTATEDPSTEVEGLLAGVDEYLVKPVAREELLERLQIALRRRQPDHSP